MGDSWGIWELLNSLYKNNDLPLSPKEALESSKSVPGPEMPRSVGRVYDYATRDRPLSLREAMDKAKAQQPPTIAQPDASPELGLEPTQTPQLRLGRGPQPAKKLSLPPRRGVPTPPQRPSDVSVAAPTAKKPTPLPPRRPASVAPAPAPAPTQPPATKPKLEELDVRPQPSSPAPRIPDSNKPAVAAAIKEAEKPAAVTVAPKTEPAVAAPQPTPAVTAPLSTSSRLSPAEYDEYQRRINEENEARKGDTAYGPNQGFGAERNRPKPEFNPNQGYPAEKDGGYGPDYGHVLPEEGTTWEGPGTVMTRGDEYDGLRKLSKKPYAVNPFDERLGRPTPQRAAPQQPQPQQQPRPQPQPQQEQQRPEYARSTPTVWGRNVHPEYEVMRTDATDPTSGPNDAGTMQRLMQQSSRNAQQQSEDADGTSESRRQQRRR